MNRCFVELHFRTVLRTPFWLLQVCTGDWGKVRPPKQLCVQALSVISGLESENKHRGRERG